ncbi:MAG TPA: pyridoxamine 5'-phosphate oxidase family protein [Candidatus Limnocylindria bacterium]|jgi:PPOX class probable F420-dependent enzyme|nr:pyridoxamine 5'-phosphate oxidase family protein [Candidatus Limnocylindria bacterium]
MSLAMTRAERETFLADTHVAVVSIADGARAPLAVPVWYTYEPGGDLRFVTGGASRKARLIRKAGRVSVCVQTETPPYRYVSIEGPATIGAPDHERDVRPTALRYLGPQMGEVYLRATAAEHAGAVLVTVKPERWLTVDYGKWGG